VDLHSTFLYSLPSGGSHLQLFPLRDELVCRCASYISKCPLSNSGVVRVVPRTGVYFTRMLSHVGVKVNSVAIILFYHCRTFMQYVKQLLGLRFAGQLYQN